MLYVVVHTRQMLYMLHTRFTVIHTTLTVIPTKLVLILTKLIAIVLPVTLKC